MSIIKTIAEKTWEEMLSRKESKWLIVFFNLLLFVVAFSNFNIVSKHNERVAELSQEVRENWVKNPDKHPHRMSHYGYLVFRDKHPLSFFDKGLDNYLGNTVFLEAHKQNTVNFSEQGLSNNILAFGEISVGMILQLLLTILIFFWGYNLVSKERENGMLKLVLTQGVSWKQILIGKSLGLFRLSFLTVCLPVLIFVLILLFFMDNISLDEQLFIRYGTLFLTYTAYVLILSMLTVLVSSLCRSSKLSLTLLVGYWLLFVVLFPKVFVIIGQSIYPSPSKVEFDIEVETEMQKHGDSHDPDDPYFTNLRDSLLTTYQVKTVKELPFNYSGFVMKVSEELSSHVYEERKEILTKTFLKQQNIVKWVAIINPYFAIKNISTSLCGTDYLEYVNFEAKSENFRYYLAQYLNNLQIKYVPNDIKSSSEKRGALDNKFWAEMDDFSYTNRSVGSILKSELFSFGSLILWLGGIYFIFISRKKIFKAL